MNKNIFKIEHKEVLVFLGIKGIINSATRTATYT